MEKISLNRKQLEKLISNDVSFSGLDISRFSMVLMAQVLKMKANRVINTHQMMDEIRCLEGVGLKTPTKRAAVFYRAPLKGIMKTHFFDASFVLKNIGIHMGIEDGNQKRLKKQIREAFDQNTSGVFDDKFINHIATGFSFGPLRERAMGQKLLENGLSFNNIKEKTITLH